MRKKLGSRFRVNETSQILEPYSVQMKAAMKQKKIEILVQMYLSMIEYPKDDCDSAFGHKRLCYSRATAGTFILNLLYNMKFKGKKTLGINEAFQLFLRSKNALVFFCDGQIANYSLFAES